MKRLFKVCDAQSTARFVPDSVMGDQGGISRFGKCRRDISCTQVRDSFSEPDNFARAGCLSCADECILQPLNVWVGWRFREANRCFPLRPGVARQQGFRLVIVETNEVSESERLIRFVLKG